METYKKFTRNELYELAWSTPMTKLAKQFGLSDVGLRKICAKHQIPTPPLGYWAKLQFGKKVKQIPLPPIASNQRDTILISVSAAREMPEAVVTAEVKAQESLQTKIIVPDVLPAKLHRIAAATKRALKAATLNSEGFIGTADAPGTVDALIARSSITRAIAIIDTIARTLEGRGQETIDSDKGVDIIVDGERMSVAVHETQDKTAHQPTKAELEAKARWEANRIKWPAIYDADRMHWRRWDHLPSGRLCIVLKNPAVYPWQPEHVLGRWYDRKTTRVEDYLNDIIVTMHSGAALIRINRLAAEEAERRRKEAADRLRRMRENKERIAKRQAFIEQKAEDYARLLKLQAFSHYLTSQIDGSHRETASAIEQTTRGILDRLSRDLSVDALNQEAVRLELYTSDDNEFGVTTQAKEQSATTEQ